MVPCDSHGKQLVIKDVLELDECATVFAMAAEVIEKFHRAPLQLARLRELQKKEYGKTQSLLSAVITHWGSQVSIYIHSLRSDILYSSIFIFWPKALTNDSKI
jgi:hypothetical protein